MIIFNIIKNIFKKKDKLQENLEDEDNTQENKEQNSTIPEICSKERYTVKSNDINTNNEKYMNRLNQYIKTKFDEVEKNAEINKN
jgi:hypothetical protein